MKRRILRLGILFAVIYVGISIAAGILIVEQSLRLPRRMLTQADRGAARFVVDKLKADLTDVTLTAADGAQLSAWLVRPRSGNGRAAIALHGLIDNRLGVAGHAELLVRHGYTVLLPDARAHGESGGAMATYGLLEASDYARWVEWLRKETNTNCVYGWGGSLGAALLLQSLRETDGYCAVVAEASFAEFDLIAADRFGEALDLRPSVARIVAKPAVLVAKWYARLRYGVDFRKASPAAAIASSRTPVLLIAGARDRTIPADHTARIAKARPVFTETWIVSEADHSGVWMLRGKVFERRVLEWYERHPPR